MDSGSDYGRRQLYKKTGSSAVIFDFVNEFALPERDNPIDLLDSNESDEPNEPDEPERVGVLRDEPDPEETYTTFRDVMTDGRYKLSSFLAASVSAHNRVIALDLVLVDRDTGRELQMQSDMHDLSWYSITSQNNRNAELLATYMKGAGYNDLFSEWWHFQDDETREKIGLNTYLKNGVSVEGWKKDDTGWRYRLNDGSFYINTAMIIEDQKYTFDVDGYCGELN